jgi:predicted nucleic acid-binding Zn ribbon protein
MDDLDRAQQREEQDRERALAAARSATLLPATGHCHYCGASVPGAAHFCDSDCRSDYEREQAAIKRNGRLV